MPAHHSHLHSHGASVNDVRVAGELRLLPSVHTSLRQSCSTPQPPSRTHTQQWTHIQTPQMAIHTNTWTHTYTDICTWTHIHTHTHAHTHNHTRMHARTQARTHTHTWITHQQTWRGWQSVTQPPPERCSRPQQPSARWSLSVRTVPAAVCLALGGVWPPQPPWPWSVLQAFCPLPATGNTHKGETILCSLYGLGQCSKLSVLYLPQVTHTKVRQSSAASMALVSALNFLSSTCHR